MKRKYAGLIALISSLFAIGLYFLCRYNSNYTVMPISLSPANTPVVQVKIEDNVYDLTLDLGSKFPMTLDKKILCTLKKESLGKVQSRDGKGILYVSPYFRIPKVTIGELALNKVDTEEENETFSDNTLLWTSIKTNKQPKSGSVGRPLLERINLLLDFPNLKMIATNHKSILKKTGYDLSKMVKIPIEINKRGIIVRVNTDLGELKFFIDTGTTITLIRSSRFKDIECDEDERGFQFYKASHFSIGGSNFGNQSMYLYDITSDLKEIDGILGMDFLEKHVIYFDYKNKEIYISQ